MLHLGVEVRLGVEVLRLGEVETSREGSWVRLGEVETSREACTPTPKRRGVRN